MPAGHTLLPAPAPDVEVWMCDLAQSDGEIRALATSLSASENMRAARFGRKDLSDRYIVGRATLRIVLARHLRIAPAAVEIARGVRGRPCIGNAQASGLDFNVSHTNEVAFIGITSGQRIGVDIEHGERTLNVDGVARKFMSEREQSMLAALDADTRRRAILRLWTCKESMSKATGDALSAPFRRLDVDTVTGLRLRNGPPPYTPEQWRLLPVVVPGDFIATVAIWHGH